MIYLSSFQFPDIEEEYKFMFELKRTCYDTIYPFQILSKHGLRQLDFEPVTILYGGNGSGKTTALNVIGEKLGLKRDSLYNRSNFFEDYVAMCRYNTERAVPKEYIVDGVRLGRWISAIRSTREHPESSNYRLDEERIRQLDSIGMRWAGESWEVRYKLAALYYKEHGDLKISQNYVVEVEGERIWLGKWLAGQKKKRSDSGQKHAMSKEQEKRLEAIGMEW